MRLYFIQYPDGGIKLQGDDLSNRRKRAAKNSPASAYYSATGAKVSLGLLNRGRANGPLCKIMYADIDLKEYTE